MPAVWDRLLCVARIISLPSLQVSPIGQAAQLSPQLAALALRTQGSAQRQSFAYFPPDTKRGSTPVRTPEGSTPAVPKAAPGESITPAAKPEVPKMVGMWEGPIGLGVAMATLCV